MERSQVDSLINSTYQNGPPPQTTIKLIPIALPPFSVNIYALWAKQGWTRTWQSSLFLHFHPAASLVHSVGRQVIGRPSAEGNSYRFPSGAFRMAVCTPAEIAAELFLASAGLTRFQQTEYRSWLTRYKGASHTLFGWPRLLVRITSGVPFGLIIFRTLATSPTKEGTVGSDTRTRSVWSFA